jgi:hypothetical protein
VDGNKCGNSANKAHSAKRALYLVEQKSPSKKARAFPVVPVAVASITASKRVIIGAKGNTKID